MPDIGPYVAWRVTDRCACGHMIIAHSACDGCVYCRCQERHIPPETAAAGSTESRDHA